MVSNVCEIKRDGSGLLSLLKESERVAEYNGLDRRQALHLRLLCEELGGLLPEIIGEFEGKIFIEYEGGVCKINASLMIDELTTERKKEIISVAKNKKNFAAVGITGKIRSAIESLFLSGEVGEAFAISATCMDASTGYYVGNGDYAGCWSLERYRGEVKKKARGAEWDELEKSVIASVADDVLVGIKGRQADVIIVKNFNN